MNSFCVLKQPRRSVAADAGGFAAHAVRRPPNGPTGPPGSWGGKKKI